MRHKSKSVGEIIPMAMKASFSFESYNNFKITLKITNLQLFSR